MQALDFAIQMETDAQAFYNQSALAVKDEAAKRMLAMLAEDEDRHRQILENIKAGKIAYIEGNAFTDIKNVFEELRDSGRSLFNENDSLANVLRKAQDLEHRGADLYQQLADDTNDDNEKEIWLRLKAEEIKHEKLVTLTREYVDTPASVLEDAEFLFYGHEETP